MDLPEDQVSALHEIARFQSLRKGENFIRAGKIPKQFAFLQKGLCRYYYLDNKGNEFTKSFFVEGTFLSSYTSMINNEPSHFTIEALEDSEIIVIPYEPWKKLYEQNNCWDKFLIAMLEKGFSVKERRERELLLYDAETRYTLFRQRFPNLEDRVKQHIIASYLGITPVALSRIRKNMGLVNIG